MLEVGSHISSRLIFWWNESRGKFTIRCVMVRVMFRQNPVADLRGSRIWGVATLETSSRRLRIALSAKLEKTPSCTHNLEVACNGE